ncbi:Modification methylase HaeIII [compost metagenome]
MKIVSLFSGAGAMDLGFINQGFEIVWANDFEKAQCETYRNNIGDHIFHGDITSVGLDDIPDCDGIIGGSPCQGFSNANRQTNFLDNPKNMLVKEYIRIVKGKKPRFFILENVPRLLTAGEGKFLNEIIKELDDYHIEIKVLNAADYGAAQKRKRAILIGSREGIIKHPEATHREHTTVGGCLNGIHNELPNQLDITKTNEIVLKRMMHVPQGGNWSSVPKEYWMPSWGNKTHSNIHKRLSLDEPSVTLANFRKSYITHPTENRILSVREAARIQGFPDDFIFYGGLSDKQQMVSNAVPVQMSEAIAKVVKIHIETENNKQKELVYT